MRTVRFLEEWMRITLLLCVWKREVSEIKTGGNCCRNKIK